LDHHGVLTWSRMFLSDRAHVNEKKMKGTREAAHAATKNKSSLSSHDHESCNLGIADRFRKN
jgi:hypothetical protein